jgi:hypothetical protein
MGRMQEPPACLLHDNPLYWPNETADTGDFFALIPGAGRAGTGFSGARYRGVLHPLQKGVAPIM